MILKANYCTAQFMKSFMATDKIFHSPSTIVPEFQCLLCVFVSLCVCLLPLYWWHHSFLRKNQGTSNFVTVLSVFLFVDSRKNIFKSYGIICLPRQHPVLLQQSLASFFPTIKASSWLITTWHKTQCKAASYVLSLSATQVSIFALAKFCTLFVDSCNQSYDLQLMHTHRNHTFIFCSSCVVQNPCCTGIPSIFYNVHLITFYMLPMSIQILSRGFIPKCFHLYCDKHEV